MKVFVGLSGGVDSAVSAALLKQEGYQVVGCFIKIWQPEFLECTWREDRLDAMRVAVALGIPFREIELSDEYKSRVVDTMIADYKKGITPNPDVLCNTHIKFGSFLSWALENGADRVATGHYARKGKHEGTLTLLRGRDSNKDQSYFLWHIAGHALEKTLFPIGGYIKQEVRALAQKLDLPNSEKPDSQGLCFIGDVSMRDFLGRYIELTPGNVVEANGTVVGRHEGAALYTIGQRHGFAVRNTNIARKQHYVISVDIAHNTITVSENRTDAARAFVELTSVHWINETPEFPSAVEVQTRHRETPIHARLEKEGERVRVVFDEPHIASPGQSLVVYEHERCLGGGLITL